MKKQNWHVFFVCFRVQHQKICLNKNVFIFSLCLLFWVDLCDIKLASLPGLNSMGIVFSSSKINSDNPQFQKCSLHISLESKVVVFTTRILEKHQSKLSFLLGFSSLRPILASLPKLLGGLKAENNRVLSQSQSCGGPKVTSYFSRNHSTIFRSERTP